MLPDALAPDRRQGADGQAAAGVPARRHAALDYGRVMRVMGELNRAGLNRVALVTTDGDARLMERAEKYGLGVAAAGHVLLFGLLSVGFLATPDPLQARVEADRHLAGRRGRRWRARRPPRPKRPRRIGRARDRPARGCAAAAGRSWKPRPEPAPPKPPACARTARPSPPPVAKAARRRKPAPPAPPSRPPRPAKPRRRLASRAARSPPEGRPGTNAAATTPRPRGGRLGDGFPEGHLADLAGQGPDTPARRAGSTRSALAGLAATRSARQIQPCADRQVDPGPGANQITTVLNLRLNPRRHAGRHARRWYGRPASTTSNGRYAQRVVELGVGARSGLFAATSCPPNSTRPRAAGHQPQLCLEAAGDDASDRVAALLAAPCARAGRAARPPRWSRRPRRARRRRSRSTSTGGISAPMPIAIPPMPTAAAAARPRRAAPTRSAASSPRSSPTTCAIPACSSRSAPTLRAVGYRRGHRARVRLLGRHRRAGAGAGLCPRQWRRHADGRLLSLRRVRADRTGAAGLRRAAVRLAPRRAQMRRRDLSRG